MTPILVAKIGIWMILAGFLLFLIAVFVLDSTLWCIVPAVALEFSGAIVGLVAAGRIEE